MSLLVDLSILRHPYCGLGQTALRYGQWYATHARQLTADTGVRITLLVPKAYEGAFGSDVDYLPLRDPYRLLPQLLPHYDQWHSIHQLSPFRPRKGAATRRILTIHDLNFLVEKSPRKQAAYLRRLQSEALSATDICCISNYTASQVRAHLSPLSARLHVIPDAVPDITQGDQRSVELPCPDKPFFLSIGVVREKKNLHTLLPLMRRMTDCQLLLAGDDQGPYADQLRQQLPQHPNVRMVGTVDDAQRRWLYAHCAALLMPSKAEGFGLPVVEAMQWGKPVFTSQLGSLPEVGGGHSFLFPSLDPDAMEATLRQGLAAFTPQRSEAEKAYAATFNLDDHMRQYWQLFAQFP